MRLPPEPTVSMCARWLKYLVTKDPAFKENVPALFRRFAEEQGYGVEELERTFAAEEEFFREQEAAKGRKNRIFSAQKIEKCDDR